ncbi:VPLPA-CTERM sorting domain-containing protein [Paracoccus sp. 11-3]|uniref:VPLPA-CTERM sorting domain-containing protein n=1 Tax=Paracoccus amoyensis TaxID=2760093 RepID=A0A926J5R1_9RHOB|nr:VPLPA-CTERM sorting domain-containing protein [Paracoccus amoyensis]MBC9246487.1 VPLPA-CTERM sorting domain-containing protein [Paracoccus amoyensis]
MARLVKSVLLILAFAFAPIIVKAATVTETFTFNATLDSGVLFCGPRVEQEAPCPDRFSTVDPSLLPYGMSFRESYAGSIALTYDDNRLTGILCHLNEQNCNFGGVENGFNSQSPTGPNPGNLDFTDTAQSRGSVFFINNGSGGYSYGTDYVESADGSEIYYYSNVNFSLSDVTYESSQPAPVPLPASLPLLAGAVLGFGTLRRWRKPA